MKKSAHKDNRGLTLVELIVGVTILAIIVVPLLHTFVVGAGTELKSRQYGEVSDIAQSLSEQIQATTMDAVLSSTSGADLGANAVNPSAKFYILSGSAYTIGDKIAPAINSGSYYVGLKSYSYGSSSYDALVTFTLDTAYSDYTTPVVVGNKMDALLNMSLADTRALLELKTQYSYLMANSDTELTLERLTRSIAFNVTKSSSSPYTYTISASFNYTGTITGTAMGYTSTTVTFADTETSSASVDSIVNTTDGSPVLSAFLFYNAYYRSNISNEVIIINNQFSDSTRSDVKVFFVNTNTDTMPVNYHAQISYKYQNFNAAGDPVNNLFFTNTPTNVSYIAYKDSLTSKTYTTNTTPAISQYLVETKALDRKFNINIKIFKNDSNYSGTPIVSIDSTKLSY